MRELPKIQNNENGIPTLYVDGKPFIGLGGELFNSNSSSIKCLRERVWPKLRPLHVNSIVATVSWEQIEPEEGVFDFTIVDQLIADARQENIRLTLIWFALWKNGGSSYVPAWVKLNREKYWYCVCEDADHLSDNFHGDNCLKTISPLCWDAVQADARAFHALMQHISEIDPDHTVIMMQLENEIGLIGSARDCSPLAKELFNAPIPDSVANEYQVAGTWLEAFGLDASEYFMAWAYAKAVQHIAEAGKSALDLPMYVNAWLQQDPDRPGVYPSGAPIAKMMRMWRLVAPALCMYAPDIYLADFEKVVAEYTANGNPLFIPETRTNVASAATVFLAIAKYGCIGFNPFGIESIFGTKRELDNGFLMSLNIDSSAFSDEGSDIYLPESYKLLQSMMHIILPLRGTNKLQGFYHFGPDNGCVLSLDEFDVRINYGMTLPGKPPAGGLIAEVAPGEFYVAGTNFRADFYPKRGEQAHINILRLEEGEFENGLWIRDRILNGDEQRIRLPFQPQVLHVQLHKF